MHHWCKFGENVSSTLQDIVLTMFPDTHKDVQTDASMDEQNKNSIPPATPRWAEA